MRHELICIPFRSSILRRASADELARLIGRAFHEDVLGPFQDSMASLGPEVLAEDDDSASVIDFPVRSALLLLATIKDEIREPSQYVTTALAFDLVRRRPLMIHPLGSHPS
jgi:hypothetical protein